MGNWDSMTTGMLVTATDLPYHSDILHMLGFDSKWMTELMPCLLPE